MGVKAHRSIVLLLAYISRFW